ncbi:MAG TPA: alanyl-tRNA editing protein [Candidatus Thermoplasmatota archaeon]|nr:alanyl-tRNA editing protein [Candidatus Thermoplasmatota archaeon]
MTQRLYLDDAYLRACDAVVVRVSEGKVVLDRTVLYAESGGQAADHGWLRWEGGEARATDAQVEGGGHVGDVVHAVEGAVPGPGTRVRVEVDWDRRYGLMRHHTAAHLVAAVVYRDFKAKFTGGQLYPDRARLDVHFDGWDAAWVKRIEAAVNAEVEAGREVRNYEVSREEFEKGDLLRTAENLVDPAVERVRITDIVGLDAQADGGTHVRNTREVGRVVMEKADNKGKGHRRLSYRCAPAP